MWNYIPSQQQVFIHPVKDWDCYSAYDECRWVDETNASWEHHKSVNVSIFVGEVDGHVLVMEVGLCLSDRVLHPRYFISLVKFIDLAVINKNEENWDERVGDQKKEHIEQIFLKVEGKSIEGSWFLVDEIVIYEVGEEGCNKHVNQEQDHQFRSHWVIIGRLFCMNRGRVLRVPDHPWYNGVKQRNQLRIKKRKY